MARSRRTERELPLAARLCLAVSANLLVNANVVNQHLGGERGGLVRVAKELAADGDIHDDVERLVERGRPGVEVGFLGGLQSFASFGHAGAPPERLRRIALAV